MKHSHVFLFLGLIGAGFSVSAAAPSAKGPAVLVAADAITSPEGFRPEPGKPIYYIFAQVYKTLGETIAGIKAPDPALVERSVVAELAKQGFVRTEIGGPMPSVFILATVGDSNFAPPDDSADLAFFRNMVLKRPGMSEAEIDAEAERLMYVNSPRARDQPGVDALVGLKKTIESSSVNTPEGAKFAAATVEDRLYISLAAFDALLFAKKEKKMLWRTSMSIDWRNDLASALPVMLASGAPFFGRDLKLPAILDDRDRRKAEVEIGDAKVVPDESKADAKSDRKK